MSSKYFHPWLPLLAVLVVLLASGFRLGALRYTYYHPDEIIAIKVSEKVARDGVLDTNWENADLPKEFKYPQYNFSGYLLFSAGVVKFAHILPFIHHWSSDIAVLRGASCLLGISIVILTLLLAKQSFELPVAIGSAFFVAVNPLLFQDGLYARPETFVTALTLAFLYVLGASGVGFGKRVFVGAFILGILAGTKVSMLLLIPILFLADDVRFVWGSLAADLGMYVRSCIQIFKVSIVFVPVGLFAGFFCAAPWAVINFKKYLFGLSYLENQYTSGHWPHGLPDGGWIDRIAYAASYFSSTAGSLWFFLALCGGGYLLWERKFRLLVIFLIFIVFAIRFSTYPVFFERNLSHLLPFFFLLASYALFRLVVSVKLTPTAQAGVAMFCVVVVSAQALGTLNTLIFYELSGEREKKLNDARYELESAYGTKSIRIAWVESYRGIKHLIDHACAPNLVEYLYPGDKYSIAAIHKLERVDGFVEVARVPTAFPNTPPSTLHTYLSPITIFLFRSGDTSNCREKGVLLLPG